MQITGMLWGSKLLKYVGFPTSEILGPEASTDDIRALLGPLGHHPGKTRLQGRRGQKG